MSAALTVASAVAGAVGVGGAALSARRWTLGVTIPWHRRRSIAVEIRTADWCERAARHVRSGNSLSTAVIIAAGLMSGTGGMETSGGAAEVERRHGLAGNVPVPLRALADDVARGTALGAAVERRLPCDTAAVDLAMTAVATCSAVGGPAAATLERVAMTLRTRAALADEIAAQSAQARLSALVLTLVPLALLLVLLVADGGVRAQLQRPAGVATAAAGVSFNLCGWLWMRHLTDRRRP